MTTMTQQERQAAREAYIAYAITDVQIDEDERGTYAMMLSAQSDVKRYKVRVEERKDGSMFAESCVCPAWHYNNRNAVACKHMEAFNVWHMNIHRSVTVMPVAEPVVLCASAAPRKRQDAPCKAPKPRKQTRKQRAEEAESRLAEMIAQDEAKLAKEERMERATLSSAKMPDWLSMLPSRQQVG